MRFNLVLVGLLCVVNLSAQKNKKNTRAEYIDIYKEMAMEEMGRTGIPASITLAQGILESGDGNSTLAVKANNHFGIKCHDWTGPSVKHDDDAKNECFRKYKSPEQSYLDHSDFLTGRNRYASLFELQADDYKGWAKGLKKAGYATSSTYAKALIGIIEDNRLYEYDTQVLASKKSKGKTTKSDVFVSGRQLQYNNRVKYIVADSGDTYSSLTEELSLFNWQLPRYNEVVITDTLDKGDYVYLQPKRSKIYGKQKTHLVGLGETIHSISQDYGIRADKLRQRNNISEGLEPAPGVMLLLRGKSSGEEIPTIKSQQKKSKNLKDTDTEEEQEFIIEYDLED